MPEFFKNSLFFRFCILLSLFSTANAFAAVPIQERALRGTAAAEARLQLIAAAESLLGTPYRYAGIDRKGLDCSGLVHLSFREGLNITVPRTSESIYSWAAKIETKELQPGDLVFFVTAGSAVSHLGIYAGGGRFIHSASQGPHTGVIYSRLDEAYWRRTYLGAGRALPWDNEAAAAIAAVNTGDTARAGPNAPAVNTSRELVWADTGYFAGFAAAWTWGGVFEGALSPFRGISALATVGHKWSSLRVGLELRPEWDRALGVFRLPATLSFGTDTFQVFAGPVYTFGEPILSLENQNRSYSGGRSWLLEAGISTAFSPFNVMQGALSLYGELAWQSYRPGDGESFNLISDIAANVRASTGIRYLWRVK